MARTDLAEFYLEAPGIVGGGQDKARAQADQVAKLNPAKAHWIQGRLAEKNKDLISCRKGISRGHRHQPGRRERMAESRALLSQE